MVEGSLVSIFWTFWPSDLGFVLSFHDTTSVELIGDHTAQFSAAGLREPPPLPTFRSVIAY